MAALHLAHDLQRAPLLVFSELFWRCSRRGLYGAWAIRVERFRGRYEARQG